MSATPQGSAVPMPGAHVPLEPKALENGRVILRSAMDYGFVGPLDIPTDHFHPEIQSTASVIRCARDAGSRDFAGVILHLIQTTPPGEAQDLARAQVADIGECMIFRPEDLVRSAENVRDYHLVKSRVHAAWKLQRTLEAGDDTAEVMREIAALDSSSAPLKREAFEFFRADQLTGTAEPMDFVEGLLTEGGASVVYGPSNCGKSFWILDLAASVATGKHFRDELEVDQGAVVYVALEGSHGATNRIQAMKQAGRLQPDSPLFLCFAPVSLLERGHAESLAASAMQAAAESGLPCRLVILDTLARAMAGGDENSGQDMTKAVQAIDVIRAATGAHVCVVHHCGKDEARGARGHSSLRAAVDTEIEVSRPEGVTISTVRVTKQRDMPAGEPLPFSLEVIELGTDRRDKPITSCTVRHEDTMMATNRSKLGRKPEVNPDTLLELLPMPTTSAWCKLANAERGISKTSFYRSLEKLKTRNAVIQRTDGSWNCFAP